jgi:hypothetical protein
MILNLVDDDKDDGEYGLLKRIFFHKSTTTSTERTPSVIDNLVYPLTTRASTKSKN